MKAFGILKLPILVGAFGAALLLSPACKAQEVANEQFADNNMESWDRPSQPVVPEPAKAKSKPVAASANAPKEKEPAQSVQLASVREPAAADVADKRKTSSGKPKK